VRHTPAPAVIALLPGVFPSPAQIRAGLSEYLCEGGVSGTSEVGTADRGGYGSGVAQRDLIWFTEPDVTDDE
jgi:hypothetical protein